MIWFTADWHFNHANILKYTNRPFSSTEEMDGTIIENLNSRVQTNDILYFLGDMLFDRGDKTKTASYYFNQIKCKNIYFIFGNHDKKIRKDPIKYLVPYCKWWHTEYTHIYKDVPLILYHYPILHWDRQFYKSIMVHGHCHGSLENPSIPNLFDCGVDGNEFMPVSIEYLLDLRRV